VKISDAVEAEVIEMNEFPPMVNNNPKHQILFARDCYRIMFDHILEDLQNNVKFNAMVTGNPGVGKSYFYLYVIYRLLDDPILLSGISLIINSGNDFFRLDGDSFISIDPDTWLRMDSSILKLVDGQTALGQLTGWSGSTILFASLSNDKGVDKPSNLMKNFESFHYFMPSWSLDELLTLNQLLDGSLKLNEEALMERVKLCGRIPRFVFGDKDEKELEQTLNAFVESASNLELRA
jgi:hypothetical protein